MKPVKFTVKFPTMNYSWNRVTNATRSPLSSMNVYTNVMSQVFNQTGNQILLHLLGKLK